ncbi:Uncharacterised protein [Chryseobacterium nakagawai]|nr:Uncharacterised protein [Chryseobacterium nakagawai]
MVFSFVNNDKIHNRLKDFIPEPYKKSLFNELKSLSAVLPSPFLPQS